jgi:hypothetical protein
MQPGRSFISAERRLRRPLPLPLSPYGGTGNYSKPVCGHENPKSLVNSTSNCEQSTRFSRRNNESPWDLVVVGQCPELKIQWRAAAWNGGARRSNGGARRRRGWGLNTANSRRRRPGRARATCRCRRIVRWRGRAAPGCRRAGRCTRDGRGRAPTSCAPTRRSRPPSAGAIQGARPRPSARSRCLGPPLRPTRTRSTRRGTVRKEILTHYLVTHIGSRTPNVGQTLFPSDIGLI